MLAWVLVFLVILALVIPLAQPEVTYPAKYAVALLMAIGGAYWLRSSGCPQDHPLLRRLPFLALVFLTVVALVALGQYLWSEAAS